MSSFIKYRKGKTVEFRRTAIQNNKLNCHNLVVVCVVCYLFTLILILFLCFFL